MNPAIKSIYSRKQATLLVDSENRIWIMSTKYIRNLNCEEDVRKNAFVTNVVLEKDETIEKCYCCNIITFTTTKKRLYVAMMSKIAFKNVTDRSYYVSTEGSQNTLSSEASEFSSAHSSGSSTDSSSETIPTEPSIMPFAFFNNGIDNAQAINIGKNKVSVNIFELLYDNFGSVTFSRGNIFFTDKTNSQLYFYCLCRTSIGVHELKIRNVSPLTHPYNYFQIIFPFDVEHNGLTLNKDTIHVSNGDYHHVLALKTRNKFHFELFTFRFPCTESTRDLSQNSTFDKTKIGYAPYDNSIYLHHQSEVYKFHQTQQKMIKICKGVSQVFVTDLDRKGCYSWVAGKSIIKDSEPNKFVVHGSCLIDENCMVLDIFGNIIIVKGTGEELIRTNGDYHIFDLAKVECYSFTSFGVIYGVNNQLYLLSIGGVPAELNVEVVETIEDSIHIQRFTDLPSNITKLHLSSNFIIVNTTEGHMYRYIHRKDTTQFKSIVFNKGTDRLALAVSLVSRKLEFSCKQNIGINIGSQEEYTNTGFFRKLMTITEMFTTTTEIEIIYKDFKKMVAHGSSLSRDFINRAIQDFHDNHIVDQKICYDAFKKYTSQELLMMGMTLHNAILQTKAPLCVRMPLRFISALRRLGDHETEISIEELEYFSRLDDPIAFEAAFSIKDNPEAIIGSGFSSYRECLQMLCGVLHDPHSQMITDLLARGFVAWVPITSHRKMNLVTLDYYVNGSRQVDREKLISKLTFSIKGNPEFFKEAFISHIRTMENCNLRTLLVNWSGSPYVLDLNYRVIVGKYGLTKNIPTIRFSSCFREIFIKNSRTETQEDIDAIISVLVFPENTIRD